MQSQKNGETDSSRNFPAVDILIPTHPFDLEIQTDPQLWRQR